MHVCMYVCMFVCMYVCMHACIYACMYHMYIYIYMYTISSLVYKRIHQVLRHLLMLSHRQLLFDLAADSVEPGDQALIIRDFAVLRRHVWFTFKLKFSSWTALPWTLFGLGHHEEESVKKSTYPPQGIHVCQSKGVEASWY